MKNRLRPLQINRIRNGSLAALMLLLILAVFAGGTALRADNRDTVDDVVRVGRDASAGLRAYESALRQSEAITSRLAQDRVFAASVLELAKKNDKVGMANKLATVAAGSKITVDSIADFSMAITVCTESKCFSLCIGDDCKLPSGKKSQVVFKEF